MYSSKEYSKKMNGKNKLAKEYHKLSSLIKVIENAFLLKFGVRDKIIFLKFF